MADRIAFALRESGYTPASIAPLLGVSRPAVLQWLSGDTKSLKASSLFALAKVTGFAERWLFSGTGPMRKEEETVYKDKHIATVLSCMERMSYDEKEIIAKVSEALAKSRTGRDGDE